MKILLLCDRGGHLQEMLDLRDAWGKYDYEFITFKSERVKNWSEPTTVVIAPWDSIPKFVTSTVKVLIRTIFNKPDVVMSTGMGYFEIFMFPLCKILKIHTIFIESGANVFHLNGTSKFVKLFADRFFVRWKELAEITGTEYGGGIF